MKAPKDKTSATTKGRLFRLSGSIRTIIVLCDCSRYKSLTVPLSFLDGRSLPKRRDLGEEEQ
jgi:hypothetical protein